MILLFTMFTAHWFMDFAMQDEGDALNKHHSIKHLFYHVCQYSSGMLLALLLYYLLCGTFHLIIPSYFLKFFFIIFVLHFITDYFTSKASNKRYKENKFYGINGFWSIIGFDQLLHTLQIVLTLYYI